MLIALMLGFSALLFYLNWQDLPLWALVPICIIPPGFAVLFGGYGILLAALFTASVCKVDMRAIFGGNVTRQGLVR